MGEDWFRDWLIRHGIAPADNTRVRDAAPPQRTVKAQSDRLPAPAEERVSLLDFVPLVGDARAGAEARQELREGHPGRAAIIAALTLAGGLKALRDLGKISDLAREAKVGGAIRDAMAATQMQRPLNLGVRAVGEVPTSPFLSGTESLQDFVDMTEEANRLSKLREANRSHLVIPRGREHRGLLFSP